MVRPLDLVEATEKVEVRGGAEVQSKCGYFDKNTENDGRGKVVASGAGSQMV